MDPSSRSRGKRSCIATCFGTVVCCLLKGLSEDKEAVDAGGLGTSFGMERSRGLDDSGDAFFCNLLSRLMEEKVPSVDSGPAPAVRLDLCLASDASFDMVLFYR